MFCIFKKKKAKEREKKEIEIRNMFLANIQENKEYNNGIEIRETILLFKGY